MRKPPAAPKPVHKIPKPSPARKRTSKSDEPPPAQPGLLDLSKRKVLDYDDDSVPALEYDDEESLPVLDYDDEESLPVVDLTAEPMLEIPDDGTLTTAERPEPPEVGEATAIKTLDPEVRAVVLTCESELNTNPDPLRTARLHYEIGQVYESAVGWQQNASEEYAKALDGAPDHVPTIQGARRMHIVCGRYAEALPLFDAEAELDSQPKRKALLLMRKGRLLEDKLDDAVNAREAYAQALALDPSSASILKALEQCDHTAEQYDALLKTYEQSANVVADDARHRAVLIHNRARLVEQHTKDTKFAAELYEAALRLDPHSLGSLEAIKRLHHRHEDWRPLTTALEREARQTNDATSRGFALYSVSRIRGERLSNRAEAVSALAKALLATPNDSLILEDLTRLYEEEENYPSLAEVLQTRVETASEKGEREWLLHNLGHVFEGPLNNIEKAIECYKSALELDPTHVPVLQALGKLLAKRSQWLELIAMHMAEANATKVKERSTAAHARIAEIYESQLRQPDDAAEHHARALTITPSYPASFKALTRLYAQADQHRELVELYERAIEAAKETTVRIAYLFKVGALWEDALADPVQALHAYRRVLTSNKENLGAIHALQRVAEAAGHHKELVDALELEAKLTTDKDLEVGLLHRAGVVLDEHLEDADAALVRLRKSLELNPTFVPSLASVGRIYYRTGRWADLLEMYRKELDVTDEVSEKVALLHTMGEMCEQKLGKNEEAIGFFRSAAELDPKYRPALRSLARRLREAGDWQGLADALRLELEGLDNSANKALTWYRVGQVCEERLSQPDKALNAYEKALEFDDKYRPARIALARLHSEKGEWMMVIASLGTEGATTEDENRAVDVVMQQAELYRDDLNEADLAVGCLEEVLRHDVGVIPALLALEPLYRREKAWGKLASVYANEGTAFADPGARIAAYRELARLQQTHRIGALDERIATYEAILSIDPDDGPALAALELIGRQTQNHQILVRVYKQLRKTADNDSLAASYLTRLGQSLEHLGDRTALKAYRLAVEKDAELLTAIRGLSRVGDLFGDARSMVQSARLEAKLTRKPEMAARLFVRAGIIRREQMNDLGAVEDFVSALEIWPDDTQAAEQIIQPLLETGQIQHLVDVLSQAAESCESPQRKTSLWLEVGGLYVTRLDKLGAGITALKRSLDATAGHIPTLRQLADAYEANEQWGEAVTTLDEILALTSDETVRGEAHLTLAKLFDEKLMNMDRAKKSVQAVLRKDPTHADALLLLADMQLRSGNEDDAVETAQRLVEITKDPRKRGAALVRVARIHGRRGDDAAAEEALTEALALEGTGGDAEREFKKVVEKHGSWVGYAAGLATHLKHASDSGQDGDHLAPTYLELATTYSEGMSLLNKAISVLKEGITATGSDVRLMRELATKLREADRLDEALVQITHLLSVEPTRPETWQQLALTFDKSGRGEDAIRALEPLVVLQAPHDSISESLGTRRARPASAAEGSFDFEVMTSMAVDNAYTSKATNLVGSLSEAIGKIYPNTLEAFGLTRRDRITPRSNHPLLDLATRLGQIFGAEFELYEHQASAPMVAIELDEPVGIIMSPRARELPIQQQTYLLSYVISLISVRLVSVLRLNAMEIEILLVGAARGANPNFATQQAQGDELNDAKELIRNTVSRKWRRAVETSAAEYVASPPDDLGRWHWAVTQTAARAALLVTDELAGSIEALRHLSDLSGAHGTRLVQASREVRDLMRFWVSDRAVHIRRRAGITQQPTTHN